MRYALRVTKRLASACVFLLGSVSLFAVPVACSNSKEVPLPVQDAAPAEAAFCSQAAFVGAPYGVRCGDFVDERGRTVLFHGINARVEGIFDVTFDDGRKALEPIPAFTAQDAARIRALGFNSIRLPINWSAIEPTEDGGIKSAYLDKIAAFLALAKGAGLAVLLDLHQDAYSKEIGEDGAPYWAIVPEPPAKLEGPLEDLAARRYSVPVLRAFSTFFGPTEDGIRLRARFAAMAAAVAKRFADDPTVIGLEVFNEPVANDDVVEAFHREVIPVIRAAATTKLVFFEPSVNRNANDRAPIGTGLLAPGTVYAPHVYTFSFTGGGDDGGVYDRDALAPSNAAARLEANGWEAPLAITEYGYDPKSPAFRSYVELQHTLQDEARASAFLWLWKESSQGSWGYFDTDDKGVTTERPAAVEALSWVRLEAVAGKLESVRFDKAAKVFEAKFEGRPSITAPNLVSLGETPGFATFEAKCDGQVVAVERTEPLQIPCSGDGPHVIRVQGL
jgi:hypothetical protein